MGILILAVLAMGTYTFIRWIAAYLVLCINRIKTIPVNASPSVAIPVKAVWEGLDEPAFLRRGIQYPVLTEKKRGRTRKAKPVIAAA